MRVELIRFTHEPEKVIKDAINITQLRDLGEKIIKGIIKAGAESPLEHAVFTFKVEGISRACSHQLVRHRIASYTQESQRYVKYEDEPKFVVPPTIENNPNLRVFFSEMVAECHKLYKEFLEAGIPAEDARYILPNAWETSLYVTMNARELRHFFKVRLDKRSQWEIRELAKKMLELVKPICPNVFYDIEVIANDTS